MKGEPWRLSFWGSSASCAARISAAKQTWAGTCGPTRARSPSVVHFVIVPWHRKETWRLISRMSIMRRTSQYNQRESMISATLVKTLSLVYLQDFKDSLLHHQLKTREWLALFSPVGTTRHGVWAAAGVTGRHRPMLRGFSQAVISRPHVSGPPDRQLRYGWPDAAVIITYGVGHFHVGTSWNATRQSPTNSLLLPVVSQRLQEQAGHGKTLTHTHRRETL